MIAPSPTQGFNAGLLAVLMHGLFLTALVFSVSWRTLPEMPVYADLWNELPLPAPALPVELTEEALPLPEPEPIPPETIAEPLPPPKAVEQPVPVARPDIALKAKEDARLKEEARQKEEARLKEETLRKEAAAQQAAEDARRQDEARRQVIRRQQEEQLRQAQEQLQQETRLRAEDARRQAIERARRQLDAELAQQIQADLARESSRIRQAQDRTVLSARARAIIEYQDRIRQKIHGLLRRCEQVPGNPEVVFRAQLMPTGEVLRLQLLQSSGNAFCDDDVERAIIKAAPLPLPSDRAAARAFLDEPLDLKLRPNEDAAVEVRG